MVQPPHPSDDPDLKLGKFYAGELWLLCLHTYVWEIMTLNTAACMSLELFCEDWGPLRPQGGPPDTHVFWWVSQHVMKTN